jgi:Threonine dehydrogenase and related Zn-dependent dehydrogenases
MDLDFKKVLLTQLIGRFYRNIYFSSYSPLQVQNLPRQSLPESSWVRVRNSLAGISGSDLHQLYGYNDIRVATAAGPDRRRFYPGHEVVGEVIEIGDDVRHLNVGDRVVLQNTPNCITAGVRPLCHACAAGNFNLCEQGAILAEPPLGGGWCEEILLHEQQLYRVPETLTDEQAVMLEPASVAMHAVLRYRPQSGDRVLIIGAGTVGLLTQQIVHALAPHAEISVLARYPFQVELATRQGAAHIIYPHDAYAGVQHATNARLYRGLFGNQTLLGGYDVIYDTIGARKTLHHALRWTRTGGAVVLIGLDSHMMNIDLTPLWSQEISLLGSTTHGMEVWPLASQEQRPTFDVVTELIERGRITPEQLITHHFALNNYKNALLTATNKAESRAVKVVFDYSLLPASVVPNVRASAPRIRRPTTIDFSSESHSGYFPIDTSGQLPAQSGTHTTNHEIAGAQRLTSARQQIGTRYTHPIVEDEDEETATALPAIPRRASHDRRSYTASTASSSSFSAQPSLENLESAAIPRPLEHTRETHPTSPLPELPITPEIPEIPEMTAQEVAREEEASTQLVSRHEVIQHITVSEQTAMSSDDDNPSARPLSAEDEAQNMAADAPQYTEGDEPEETPEDAMPLDDEPKETPEDATPPDDESESDPASTDPAEEERDTHAAASSHTRGHTSANAAGARGPQAARSSRARRKKGGR